MDLGTVLVSLGGGTGSLVIGYVLNATKASKGELRLRDERIDTLRRDLSACEGTCIEAKDLATRAQRTSDADRAALELERTDRVRAQREADYWRAKYEEERDRAR